MYKFYNYYINYITHISSKTVLFMTIISCFNKFMHIIILYKLHKERIISINVS